MLVVTVSDSKSQFVIESALGRDPAGININPGRL